jgi:hypothetical protein
VLQLPYGRKEKYGTLWRGYAHGPQQDALGMLAGRRTTSPSHLQGEGGSQTQDQTTAAEPPRAGAIGGGSAASFRCRRIFRITSPCVMAAMIRSAPRWHQGQRAMSRAKTRCSSRAQLQHGTPVSVSSSTPCWRGVGMTLPHRWLWGAKQPPERTRWTRGRGTRAASFSSSAHGERRIPMVPSDHGWVKVETRSPLASCARRSRDTAPRAV